MKISEECKKCWNETFDLGAKGAFHLIRKLAESHPDWDVERVLQECESAVAESSPLDIEKVFNDMVGDMEKEDEQD